MKKIWKMCKFVGSLVFLGFPAWVVSWFVKPFHKDLWLVYECGRYARDNGYWFFKYVRENHKDQEVVYVIDKNSQDFDKVNSLGKTVGFRTFSHWLYYFVCSKEISSHPHFKPTNYMNKALWQNKTVFLQHGITRDITGYTADKMKIKMFVTGATQEDKFIKENYGHNPDSVKLVGFARHDQLLNFEVIKDQILIMPTWRKYLTNVDENGFRNSTYFKSWNSLLTNEKLLEYAKKNNLKIIFYLHRELQKFAHCFNSNENIIIAEINNYDVQTLLKTSELLVTDYSSVFFDFAYMNKPVIWYVFDEEEYRKDHHSKGYFDHNNNILGICSNEEDKTVDLILHYHKKNYKLSEEEAKNIDEFFPFRDGKNCERIYNEIKRLK